MNTHDSCHSSIYTYKNHSHNIISHLYGLCDVSYAFLQKKKQNKTKNNITIQNKQLGITGIVTMCLRRVSVSYCLVAILSCLVNVNFCMASDSIYNNAGTNDNVYKVIITPYFPADYLQSSFGLSGLIDIGSVNLLKLGSHLSFNISSHIGLSWTYKNNGTYCDVQDPDSDNNQSLIYETKSKMSYVFALVHPNISFLRDRISFGPLFGLKHGDCQPQKP